MGKIFKTGRVVILTNGRHAGKKGIVVKCIDEGSSDKPFEHAIVAGIDRPPRRVHKGLNRKQLERRTRLKGFVKIINLKHMMPTRYNVNDINFDKNLVTKEKVKDPARRKKLRAAITAKFQARYLSGNNRWLFHKLKF